MAKSKFTLLDSETQRSVEWIQDNSVYTLHHPETNIPVAHVLKHEDLDSWNAFIYETAKSRSFKYRNEAMEWTHRQCDWLSISSQIILNIDPNDIRLLHE